MDDMSTLIARLRKEKNLTQKELADRLGVTDKAVSKWETGKSYPDIALIPVLAAVLGVSTDVLLSAHEPPKGDAARRKITELVPLICKAVGLAMGVALVVLNALDALDFKTTASLAGIGIFCLALAMLHGTGER